MTSELLTKFEQKKQFNAVDAAIGARLRICRTEQSISQEKLGEALGVTFQQVQKYEKGANRISASKLEAIARFLNVPVSYFFQPVTRQPTVKKVPILKLVDMNALTLAVQDEKVSFSGVQDADTKALVLAYSRVSNAIVKKRIFDLVVALAKANR